MERIFPKLSSLLPSSTCSRESRDVVCQSLAAQSNYNGIQDKNRNLVANWESLQASGPSSMDIRGLQSEYDDGDADEPRERSGTACEGASRGESSVTSRASATHKGARRGLAGARKDRDHGPWRRDKGKEVPREWVRTCGPGKAGKCGVSGSEGTCNSWKLVPSSGGVFVDCRDICCRPGGGRR